MDQTSGAGMNPEVPVAFADLVITFVADREWFAASRVRCVRPDGTLDGDRLDRSVRDYFVARGASAREVLIATALFAQGALYTTQLWHDALARTASARGIREYGLSDPRD